jgi:hypothetical protein
VISNTSITIVAGREGGVKLWTATGLMKLPLRVMEVECDAVQADTDTPMRDDFIHPVMKMLKEETHCIM